MSSLFHVIIYVPTEKADAVRQALGESGAGCLGEYDFCSFSLRGTGRFRPSEEANPAVGSAGRIEAVEEERIEVLVPEGSMQQVMRAVVDAHPYEEPAIHVLPMRNYKEWL